MHASTRVGARLDARPGSSYNSALATTWGRAAGSPRMFDDLYIADFWEESAYADAEYVDQRLTAELVMTVERELKYKLPVSYVELMRLQNGGIPKRKNHRMKERTSWARDHIAIHGIAAIGDRQPYSLLGEMGARFWIDEWGYPAIGVYFADCPSAGHDM